MQEGNEYDAKKGHEIYGSKMRDGKDKVDELGTRRDGGYMIMVDENRGDRKKKMAQQLKRLKTTQRTTGKR